MEALKILYNGIMNDFSIRRYSIGWKQIIDKLEKRYKVIPKTNQQFENKLLINALNVANGSLKKDIEMFMRELSINIETLRLKNNK